MTIIKKKKYEDDPSIEKELTVLNQCLELLASLKNYQAELRAVKYLLERLKSDKKRRYSAYD